MSHRAVALPTVSVTALAGVVLLGLTVGASQLSVAAGQSSSTGAEPVGMPAAEEAGEPTAKPKKEIDTRLLVNIAGCIAVGLLVLAGIGVTIVARRARE